MSCCPANQVADAQEVRWACGFAAFASHTILHTWWRRHLLGSVDSGRDHLQHISRTSTNTKSAANASVVDFHCMGPSSHLQVFRVQKWDEHNIRVLQVLHVLSCLWMSFAMTFGSTGPTGTGYSYEIIYKSWKMMRFLSKKKHRH